MHFHGPVIRPQTDADSLFIEVTSGCSHNACRYCTYYKDAPFAVSPEEEIREDLRELASYKIPFRRIWLQGVDPFLLSAARLARIAALIHEAFPSVQSIGGYGRADSLRNKTVEELKKRKDLGYTGIVFDVESADEEILTFMNKGYHASEIVPQLSKMDEAGLACEIIYLAGLGGAGRGIQNAKVSAEALNQLHPDRILIPSLTIFPDTPLMQEVRSGAFQEASEGERIREIQTFLQELTIDTLIDARNASAVISLYGRIPEKKQAMIGQLQKIYDTYGEVGLRARRDSLTAI